MLLKQLFVLIVVYQLNLNKMKKITFDQAENITVFDGKAYYTPEQVNYPIGGHNLDVIEKRLELYLDNKKSNIKTRKRVKK
jgi:hypothetical protein